MKQEADSNAERTIRPEVVEKLQESLRLPRERFLTASQMRGRLEAEALATELAGMEQECSCWHVIDRNEGRSETIRKAPNADCPDCHGTGKVFVFDDSVRLSRHEVSAACLPGCRGWTAPSRREDFMTWCWALADAHLHIYLTLVDECDQRLQVVLCSNQEWSEGSAVVAEKAERLLTLLA